MNPIPSFKIQSGLINLREWRLQIKYILSSFSFKIKTSGSMTSQKKYFVSWDFIDIMKFNIFDRFKLATLSNLWIGQTYWVYTELGGKLTKHIVRRKLRKEEKEEYQDYKAFLEIVVREERCFVLK